MFEVTVRTGERVLYRERALSVALPGDTGDYEILPFHKPLLGLLRAGEIVIDGRLSVPIRRGVVRFRGERLVALVETDGDTPAGER